MQDTLLEPLVASPAPPPPAAPTSDPTPPAKEQTVSQRSLALVKTAIKEFDTVEAGLARLQKRYANVVFNVSTTKGMKEATDARMAIREPRYAVKNALDAAKKPLNELKADITARAEALTAEILKLETPIDEQIKAEEKRKADEKEAREAADRARLLAITERISAIRAMGARASTCRTAARVEEIKTALAAVDLTGFDEFEGEAVAAHTAATETVTNIHAAKVAEEAEREERRLAQEAEDARIKAAADALAQQQAELERQRKEFADQQAAFLAQQQAAVQTFQQAAADHEAKPLPVDASPAQVALHGLGEAAVAAGNAIVEELQAPAVHSNGAPIYSTTTFKDNGEPIMLDENGKRSIFCDVADDADDTPPAAQGQDFDLVDTAVGAGFDLAMQGSKASQVQHDGSPYSITDQEVVDVAVDAVAMYFGISEQQASTRLAAVHQWIYQGHALAAA